MRIFFRRGTRGRDVEESKLTTLRFPKYDYAYAILAQFCRWAVVFYQLLSYPSGKIQGKIFHQ